MTDDETRKFVVFVDCLGYDDVENHTEFIRDHVYDGVMNAGNPYVTPKVMGEIYTGKNPAEHALPSVSRYGQDSRLRPAAPTLPEIVAESDAYGNVINLGLPFIVPPTVQSQDTYWHVSEAMGRQSILPQESTGLLTIPGPAGNLADPDDDSDRLLAHRMDHVQNTFGTARTVADLQDFEVSFISVRDIDSYCHYRYTEKGEGQPLTDREYPIAEIDHQIEALTGIGDVFVFGDHGATEMESVFRINRWLMEKGYLEVDIDIDFIRTARKRGVIEEGEGPGEVIHTGLPGVEVDEEASVAISDDPFSGGLTLLDGATDALVDDMIDELETTEYIGKVDWTRDMWDGPYLDECPDLYPYRVPGVFISGNLAEEMGGPEVTRSGVHHPWGAFGSTTEIDAPEDQAAPTDIFGLILDDFLGIDPGGIEAKPQQYGAPPPEGNEGAVKERLQDLGYL